MASLVEEALKKIQNSDGVEGFIILNTEGLLESFHQKLNSVFVNSCLLNLFDFRRPHQVHNRELDGCPVCWWGTNVNRDIKENPPCKWRHRWIKEHPFTYEKKRFTYHNRWIYIKYYIVWYDNRLLIIHGISVLENI